MHGTTVKKKKTSSSLSAERIILTLNGSVRMVTASLTMLWALCLVQYFTCFELRTLHKALVFAPFLL